MKSTKTKLLLTASILICLTGWALAQDQQIPARQIKFETSEQQEDWPMAWEGLGVIKPKFMAKFTLKIDRPFEDVGSRSPSPSGGLPGMGGMGGGIRMSSARPSSSTSPRVSGPQVAPQRVTPQRPPAPAARRSPYPSGSETPRMGELIFKDVVSEQQMAFIKQRRYFNTGSFDGAGLYQDFMFYAVTAEDARKMAQRYIEYHDQQADSRIQEIKDNIAQNEKIIADADQRLPQIEAELKPVEERANTLGVMYNGSRSLAEERRTEFYKMLSLLKIDIAGYQAKVEVLRSYLEEISRDKPTYESTRQMLIEQEAELAGILGRQKEIASQIAHINEFYQAYSQRSSLWRERSDFNSDRNRALEQIQESEQTLANLPAELTPVELLENKVIIYPVREK